MKSKRVMRERKGQLFSLRLTPRMRFGLELLARKWGTNVAAVVTVSVEQMFNSDSMGLRLPPRGRDEPVIAVDFVWSPHEHERFARLGEYFPELLSDGERYLWRMIEEDPRYWKRESVPVQGSRGKKMLINVDLEKLEADWSKLKARAGIPS